MPFLSVTRRAKDSHPEQLLEQTAPHRREEAGEQSEGDDGDSILGDSSDNSDDSDDSDDSDSESLGSAEEFFMRDGSSSPSTSSRDGAAQESDTQAPRAKRRRVVRDEQTKLYPEVRGGDGRSLTLWLMRIDPQGYNVHRREETCGRAPVRTGREAFAVLGQTLRAWFALLGGDLGVEDTHGPSPGGGPLPAPICEVCLVKRNVRMRLSSCSDKHVMDLASWSRGAINADDPDAIRLPRVDDWDASAEDERPWWISRRGLRQAVVSLCALYGLDSGNPLHPSNPSADWPHLPTAARVGSEAAVDETTREERHLLSMMSTDMGRFALSWMKRYLFYQRDNSGVPSGYDKVSDMLMKWMDKPDVAASDVLAVPGGVAQP